MEDKTPETQDKSEEQELIAGKFKSQEELVKAYEEAEKRTTELSESLDREQRLNHLLASEEKLETPEPDEPVQYAPLTNVFDEDQANAFQSALKSHQDNILKQTQRLIHQAVTSVESRRQATEKFYGQYPELKGFEREVDEEADRLTRELGERVQRVPFERLAQEVASRTKSRLNEAKKRLTKSAMHFEGGEVSEPAPPVKEENAQSSSTDERLKDYFDSEVKALRQKQSKSLWG